MKWCNYKTGTWHQQVWQQTHLTPDVHKTCIVCGHRGGQPGSPAIWQAVGLGILDKGNGRCRLTRLLRWRSVKWSFGLLWILQYSSPQPCNTLASSEEAEIERLYLSLVPPQSEHLWSSGPTQSYSLQISRGGTCFTSSRVIPMNAIFENHPLRKLVKASILPSDTQWWSTLVMHCDHLGAPIRLTSLLIWLVWALGFLTTLQVILKSCSTQSYHYR